MDLFYRRIISVLRGRIPRDARALREVGFSHDKLRLHLKCLVNQGLILEEKTPSKEGRPKRVRREECEAQTPVNPERRTKTIFMPACVR